ncbi:MAG: ATP-grasp domain-containing protein [Paludibacteraceae bacterium]|nr:ATP-grasp domain-containing protein [Paludibacteraceae bacterium]
MKKILMVGAGIGQLFLSKKVKERGFYLIAVTLPGNQPVIKIADRVYYHDIFDMEGVLKIAQTESVDAVLSDQNDRMMPTVAYVAEKMNLPGLNVGQVNSYCDKNKFREMCEKLKIPVPKYARVIEKKVPENMRDVPYPWIVKPADSQSSLGVRKVNGEVEYYEALMDALSISQSKTAIVESFFCGDEIVVEGFVYHGKYYPIGVADRVYFELANLFIPSQTIFPSRLDTTVTSEIIAYEKRLAQYVNPDFAIVHSEYLYDKKKHKVCIVESALRGGGMYISSHLVPLYSGIDLSALLLDCATKEVGNVLARLANKKESASAYVSFYLPEGEIVEIEGLAELKGLSFVKMLFLDDIKIGNKTSKFTHKGHRMGPIIIAAESRLDIENMIQKVQKTLNISVRGSDGKIRGIMWS